MRMLARTASRVGARALALVLAVPFSAARLAQEEDGRGWRWTELELDVWIDPDFGSVHIEGVGRLVLEAERSSGPELELNDALLELSGIAATRDVPPAVPAAELGSRLAGDRRVATARFRSAEPYLRGAELGIEFQCDGKGSSGQFAMTQKAALASWTQAWYPVPSGDAANLSRRMAAPGLTRFHLPSGWQSVSNGEPVAMAGAPGDEIIELWRVSLPVARSFACAPFTTVVIDVDGREVGIHRLKSAGQPPDVELRAIAQILRTLEQRYGPYPYPGYRVAEVPLGVGDFLGSSEQGFIMVRPVAFDAPDGNLALFAHELAHGWWGNQVSSDGPGSMLLDEALAQYSAVVAIEAMEGERAATDFLRFSRPGYVDQQCARGYFQMWRDGRDRPLSSGEGDAHTLADSKAHWVYRMLHETLGDERFFATLRGVLRDFTATPLTLPELRARFERAAPEANLARFFAQWLDRTGAPILECEWRAEGDHALVRIRQVQPGEPYALPLEVAVDSAAGRRVHVVELEQREASLTLPGDAPPTGVELDPRHRLLIWTDAYGPKPGG
jgi:peptidase M1-like protein